MKTRRPAAHLVERDRPDRDRGGEEWAAERGLGLERWRGGKSAGDLVGVPAAGRGRPVCAELSAAAEPRRRVDEGTRGAGLRGTTSELMLRLLATSGVRGAGGGGKWP